MPSSVMKWMPVWSWSAASALPLAFALCLLTSPPARAQSIDSELVASGLSSPTDIASPPGDERLFVVELTGRVPIIEGGSVLATPYFDLSGSIQGAALSWVCAD